MIPAGVQIFQPTHPPVEPFILSLLRNDLVMVGSLSLSFHGLNIYVGESFPSPPPPPLPIVGVIKTDECSQLHIDATVS
jgi:hypothetical protein